MWTYLKMEQTLIPNTVMQIGLKDGVHEIYRITPVDGCVLHDNTYDRPILDPDTMEENGKVIVGYRTTTASCAASYDFTVNPRGFYAVPADQVPGSVYDGHEVM